MALLPGQLTLQQIRDQIATVLFNTTPLSANTYPTQTNVQDSINKYYKRFYSMNQWVWDKATGQTVSTVAGQKNVVMPDACMAITNMTIENLVRKVIVYPQEKFKAVAPGGWTNIGNAVPVYCVESQPAANNALTYDLWPAPDAIYTLTIDYYRRITPMVNDNDVSIIPPEFEDCLIHGPLQELLMMLVDQRASFHAQEYQAIMKRAWIRNEQMATGLNSWRDSATENLNVPWPGLVQPYAP